MAASCGQAHRIGEFVGPPREAPSMRAIRAPRHVFPQSQGMRRSLHSGCSDGLFEAHDSSPGLLFGFLCATAVSVPLWAAIGWVVFVLLA